MHLACSATHAFWNAGAGWRRSGPPSTQPESAHLFKTSGYTLESVACLLEEPLHYAGGVVAVRHIVAEGGEAVRFATLLHFGELLEIELLLLDGAPIVFGVVHGEARRQRSIGANDQPILTGAATPVLADTAHEALHVLQAGDGIGHFVALALLVDEPVK